MFKRLFFALLALTLISTALPSFAQSKGKGSISFDKTLYDFGNIKEDGGPVTHVFEFTNTGDGNLVIQSAKAECGCTKPEFPEQPIAPGKKGSIKVTFHPAGRPGGFTKIVTVRCSGSPGKVNLKIRGTVVPSSKSLSQKFPEKRGDLYFENLQLNIGELPHGARHHAYIDIYNGGNDSIIPVLTSQNPALELSLIPDYIAPGEISSLRLFLNSARIEEPGFYNLAASAKWGPDEKQVAEISEKVIILP